MEFLKGLGIQKENEGSSTGTKWIASNGSIISSYSPVDGQLIGAVKTTDHAAYEQTIQTAQKAFNEWRNWPAPKRGEVVRQLGEALRAQKQSLGQLVSYEMGKSLQEGLGEVQEMIDICDFAVGLSRQLYGLTMHSERPSHRMYEQWHPMGIVGIISAFNFPVAVWSWNAALAWVCGNVTVWKPSEKTPICGNAVQHIVAKVFEANQVPEGVNCLIQGDRTVGEWMSNDSRIPLVSATGSTRMGKELNKAVAGRLGKTILELGGNNAIIISEHADLDMSLIGAVFGAVGTAGQRCTTTRRLIRNLINLKSIVLSQNHIKILPDDLFEKNTCLEKIFLNWNKLYKIHKNQFSNLTKLKILILDSNRLKSIDNEIFKNLKNLKFLSLNNNNINCLNGNEFKNLTIDCQVFLKHPIVFLNSYNHKNFLSHF